MSAEPAKVRVFLCGEGANELGGRIGHSAYQNDEPGVLAALLLRVQPAGWAVCGARDWKSIRKLRMGRAAHADTHNVLGIAHDAMEAKCDVLAFSRDLDRDPAREEAINEGIRRVPAVLARAPEVIGGVAKPTLEGWILAVLGQRGVEALSPRRAAQELSELGIAAKDGAAMVRAVEEADLTRIPDDARSLMSWLDRARDVLPRRVAAVASEAASARSGEPVLPQRR